MTPGTEIRLRVELDGYESVLTRAKPSGAAAGRAAAARGGLYGVIEGHARGAHLALVPNPIAVDLVPVGEKLPELPAERERVNGLLAGCKKPIDVREDCSLWDGPRRLVRVRAKQMLVAGRDESGGVFVMPYDPDPAGYQASKTEPALDPCNRVYREVTTVLGARLERAIDVMFTGTQLGCYLQFDRPVYSHLRSLSVEP